MVVLEAMLSGVAVVYSKHAGVAEVIKSGLRFEPENTTEAADRVMRLLTDQDYWYSIVQGQLKEIRNYHHHRFEFCLKKLWQNTLGEDLEQADK